MRVVTDEVRARWAAHKRRQREQRRARGECVQCGSPLRNGLSREGLSTRGARSGLECWSLEAALHITPAVPVPSARRVGCGSDRGA